MNNLFQDHLGAGFFIENIPNGLLYFYKDFNIYRAMIQPYQEKNVTNYLKTKTTDFSPTLLEIPNIHEENFPKEGIITYFEIIKGDLEQIMTPTIEHFRSFGKNHCQKSAEIKVKKINENRLKVVFCTYQCLQRYLEDRASLVGGLIRQYLEL